MNAATPNATMELGRKIVDYCNAGENLKAIKELYAADVVSVEAAAGPDMPQTLNGLEAVLGKTQWWIDNHTVHSGVAEGPFPHGDRFILMFKYDVTPKAGPMAGKRIQMNEAGLYTQANGRVVKEEFFYHMG